MSLRAVVLQAASHFDNLWHAELLRRGHQVLVAHTTDEIVAVARGLGEMFDLVVLDGLPTKERRSVIGQIRFARPFSEPVYFWVVDPVGDSREAADAFYHELSGPAHVIVKGDVAHFSAWLDFMEQHPRFEQKPTFVVLHSYPLDETRFQGRCDLLRHHRNTGCHPEESILDVLLPGGRSLLAVGRDQADPLRIRDLYLFDRLARTTAPLPVSDLTSSMTDPARYPLAGRVSEMARRGLSNDTTKNEVKRLRAALDSAGLDGHAIVRSAEGGYLLDRNLIQIDVEHIDD